MANQSGDGHVIICVDDDPGVLTALRRLFRSEPYVVLTTGQPAKALEWIRLFDVSLVLSDERMPGQRGVALLEEVRRRSPSTARVILTGYPQAAVQTPGLPTKIECLITKPWDGVMLRKSIRQMLRDRDAGLSWMRSPSEN